MNYINNQLTDILREILNGEFQSNPVGHHNLGRHFVFSINDSYGKEFILKIYGKEDRWYKEVTALNLLKNKIPCPQIINKGKLENGVEWVLMSKIRGVILEKVWHEITTVNKKLILEQLGEILSNIHNNSCYNYFGCWKEICNTLSIHTDFLEYRKEKDFKIMNDIFKQELPDKEFLIEVFHQMKEFYDRVDADNNTCICHHDFSARNTLVINENGLWKVSGIIDFEHCYPNDPYIDFTDLYQTVFIKSPIYEQAFLDGYCKGRVLEKNFHEKVRYYLYNKGLFICSWAYTCANDYYLEGIKLLKWLMKNQL